jgi:thiol-disulfide isomerase/thioredoxin
MNMLARRQTTALVRRAAAPSLVRASLARHRSLATVAVCGSEDAFDAAKSSESGAVVYFTATWCGPCRMISPIFEDLAKGNETGATFLKVDVDDMAEVAADAQVPARSTLTLSLSGPAAELSQPYAQHVRPRAQVTAMPTFQFYKSGKCAACSK